MKKNKDERAKRSPPPKKNKKKKKRCSVQSKTRKKRVKGAKVEISWERSSIEVLERDEEAKIKENPRNVG